MDLPGVERLMEVCRRLGLDQLAKPIVHAAPSAMAEMNGLPFDLMLASIYSRWSKVSFATDVAGIVLAGNEDSEFSLERHNAWWNESHQAHLQMQLFLFAGEPLLAYHYATVPALADPQGLQPVVHVDTYEFEGPVLLPIASNVDRFFDTYSRFLEELAATPEFKKDRKASLTFPWDVPHLLARDTPLVELLLTGRLDSAMPQDKGTQQWRARILELAARG